MALHQLPDHLVAEIAQYCDAASDVLALERALEAASFSSTKSKAKAESCFDLLEGQSRFEPKEALSPAKNPEIGAETAIKCVPGTNVAGAGQGSAAREPDANDEVDDDDNDADDALFVATPTPPLPSLLEEVLRLRWQDAWVLAGIPREAGIEAGVACAYAAALAAAGGPPVRSCALFAFGNDDDDEGSDDDAAAAAEATRGLFGMEMSPTPPSPSVSSSASSPSSVFFLLDPPPCCGGASSSSKRGKHSHLSSASSSPSFLPYRHLPPASAVARALEALSLDLARLKQAARLAVAADLGPEPPLLRRAFRGHSYSPPEERGGLLLSSDEDDEEVGEEECGGGGVRTSSPSSFSSPSSSSSASRSRSRSLPALRAPRLGEVSAEFLAWQTAAGHLASAFSSRLARCAAAARGKMAARELAEERRRSEAEERKGKEGVAVAA